jgi:hypothetical protein
MFRRRSGRADPVYQRVHRRLGGGEAGQAGGLRPVDRRHRHEGGRAAPADRIADLGTYPMRQASAEQSLSRYERAKCICRTDVSV